MKISLWNTSYLIWVMIDPKDFNGSAQIYSFLLHFIEFIDFFLIFLSISIFWTFILFVASKRSTLHQNMKIIVLNVIGLNYLQYYGRIFLFMAEYEYFKRDSPIASISILFISSLRVYVTISSVTTLLSIFVERAFATLHLVDYEKTRKRYVGLIPVLATLPLNLFPTYMFTAVGVYNFQTFVLSSVPPLLALSIVCSTGLNILRKRNTRELLRLKKYHQNTLYCLSFRFQLEENVRILECFHQIVTLCTVLNAFMALSIIFGVTIFRGTLIEQLLYAFLDMLTSMYGLIVMIATYRCLPPFKQEVQKNLQILFAFLPFRRLFRRIEPVLSYRGEMRQASELYFLQYRSSWT